jgi:hypothetical protein
MRSRQTLMSMCHEMDLDPFDALATLIDALLDHHLRGQRELRQSGDEGKTIASLVDQALTYEEWTNIHEITPVQRGSRKLHVIQRHKAAVQAQVIDLFRQCRVQAELEQEATDEEP